MLHFQLERVQWDVDMSGYEYTFTKFYGVQQALDRVNINHN